MLEPSVLKRRFVRPFTRGTVRKAMRLANRARAAGDWQTVVSYYTDALGDDPGLPMVWAKLGDAQKQLGDLAGAEASYRRSLAIDGQRPETHLELGHVLELLRRFEEAAGSYLGALRLDPACLQAKRELSAFGYDEPTIEVARTGGSLPFPRAVVSVQEADRARAAGDWPTAAAYYMEALQVQPEWAAIWVQLGHAQKEQGDLAAAETSYRRALTIDPDCADTHLQLGHVLKLQERFAEAGKCYFRAVQLDREGVDGLRAWKEILALGYSANSVRVGLRSGSLPFPSATLSARRADHARAAGDWRAAATHYMEALETQPEWAAIWVQLGHAQKEQGDLGAAESSYRRALAIEPGCADTHLQLGHALKLKGRLAEASASYFSAVKLDPKSVDGMWARKELLGLGHANHSIGATLKGGALGWPPAAQGDDGPGSRRFLSTIAPQLVDIRDASDGLPVLFRQRIRLPQGETGIFIDVQTVSSPTVPDVEVALVGAMGKLPVQPVPNRHGPHIATFRCHVDTEMEAEFVLKGELPSDSLIRRIEVGPANELRSWVVPYRGPTSIDPPCDQIRNLIIGSTGVCNASCIHCPTNKLLPSARWTGDMPMELFNSLVDQILGNEIFITGYMSLGLFGDGLVDRYVAQRAARLHSAFPHASLHVNTNGAAYNPSRHAPLGSLVDTLAIHIETLDEEKYARLMEPLKLPNVLPKIHQIITDMPEVATIASPVHRDNIHELPQIREYFANCGVRSTIFTGMSNRCSRDEIFQELAVAPSSGSCAAEIISDLIVDWDGLVLVCCNDFLRQQPIGNLKEETLMDILHGPKRRRVFDALRDGAWEDIDTCRTCKFSAPAI